MRSYLPIVALPLPNPAQSRSEDVRADADGAKDEVA